MNNKINDIYFLDHSLIEWSSDNSKVTKKMRNRLMRRLHFQKMILAIKSLFLERMWLNYGNNKANFDLYYQVYYWANLWLLCFIIAK